MPVCVVMDREGSAAYKNRTENQHYIDRLISFWALDGLDHKNNGDKSYLTVMHPLFKLTIFDMIIPSSRLSGLDQRVGGN